MGHDTQQTLAFQYPDLHCSPAFSVWYMAAALQAADLCMESAPRYVAGSYAAAQQSGSATTAVLICSLLCLQTNKVAVRYHPEFPKLLKYISIIAPVSPRPVQDLLPFLTKLVCLMADTAFQLPLVLPLMLP